MVGVQGRCSHESCTTRPSFNVVGSKKALYCKKHAEHGMVDVKNTTCAHDPCTSTPRWGILHDGYPSVCTRHKINISADLVIDFKLRCKVAGCKLLARWGLSATQPTHCPDHGRVLDGLSRTVGADRKLNSLSNSSHSSQRDGPLTVKAECLY